MNGHDVAFEERAWQKIQRNRKDDLDDEFLRSQALSSTSLETPTEQAEPHKLPAESADM
jgi:hypothetical protein